MGYTTEFEGVINVMGDEQNLHVFKSFMDELYDTRHGDDAHEDPGFPSFYCQWVFDDHTSTIQWDGGEKFYGYVEWMKIVCKKADHFGLVCNGKVRWQGENLADTGVITVEDNIVSTGPLKW